jgi:RpiB/LacA/LacB family sugar-phosphate isomerase
MMEGVPGEAALLAGHLKFSNICWSYDFSRHTIEGTAAKAQAERARRAMRVAVGSDHAGFDLKEQVAVVVRELGHEVLDLGADNSTESVDYPDYSEAVGKAIIEGRADRGVLICGSGVGASVAANKLPGVRAGLCHDTYAAHQGVEHDDMNVLVMGSRIIGAELARELVKAYLAAEFSGGERHIRRLEKVHALEKKYSK